MEFRDKPMQNLVRIPEKDICKNAQKLLLDGETVVGAYKTVRDQVVFTTHRIILVDMQGVTGTRQEIFVLPYRKVLHFGIQTAGFGDPLQASQLTVCFADEHEAKFGFKVRLHWTGRPVCRGQCHQPPHPVIGPKTAGSPPGKPDREPFAVYEKENGKNQLRRVLRTSCSCMQTMSTSSASR